MTASAAQISANQANAQKSTGPITDAGKNIIATNAVKHGLFSKNLILADEDPFEYRSLLEQLRAELKPSGILEQTLTERIAVSLWRQKRLLRSETASIELNRKPKNIVEGVNQQLCLTFSKNPLSEKDLVEVDSEHIQWCNTILEEYDTYDFTKLLNINKIKELTPLIYQQLVEDAEAEQETLADYLNLFQTPSEYFTDLAVYCRDQIKQIEQRPVVLEIAALVKSKKAILQEKAREAFAKYQVMIDNELYKALKALREAQEWRLKTLDELPNENGFVLEKAG